MSELPEEIILHIFRFIVDEDLIRVIPLICKQFHRLSRDDSLWVPRWINWRHNGGLAFLEHSYHNYLYMMRTWREWLRKLQSEIIISSSLSNITVILENVETVVYFPFYIPRSWIENLEN